jgi:hypothetical protein
MQQDTKFLLGSGVATVIFIVLTSMFPALRVLVLLVLFIFMITCLATALTAMLYNQRRSA